MNEPTTTPEPGGETLDSLRDALREAQRRLAYYDRFGPMLEEQMSTVVAKAAEVAKESEQAKADMEHEVGRLRQEAESLRAECDWRRSEAASIIAQAHHDAAGILSRARNEVSTIVTGALTQLEQAQREVLQSTIGGQELPLPPTGPVDLTPPSASHVAWNPLVNAEQTPHDPWADDSGREGDQEASGERSFEVPADGPALPESSEAPADDAVVTYLTVHSNLPQETLPQFGRSLESLPGVRGTAVARMGDDTVELVVAHQRDVDLLAQMRSLAGIDFRLVARGEGLVEIELLDRNAAPRLRA